MNRTLLAPALAAIVVLTVLNIIVWRAALKPTPIPWQTLREDPTPTRTQMPTPTPTRQPSATQPPATATPRPTQATPTRAAATPSPTPTPRLPTPSPTPATLTSVDQVRQAVERGQTGIPFRIVVTEQEVNEALAAYLRGNQDVAVSEAQVTLVPGSAIITGKARVFAFTVGFKATCVVVVSDGRPRLKVTRLDLLAGLVPGLVKDKLIEMIERSADLPLLEDLPVRIERVDLEQGQAVVVGTT